MSSSVSRAGLAAIVGCFGAPRSGVSRRACMRVRAVQAVGVDRGIRRDTMTGKFQISWPGLEHCTAVSYIETHGRAQ